MRRIVVGDNSPTIFTIVICFIKSFLQASTSLNSTRIFHQNRRSSKSTDVTWRHQPLFDPLFVPNSWDISLGKKQLFMDGQNSRSVLGDTFFSSVHSSGLLTLSLPKWMMEFCKVTLPQESSVDEILSCCTIQMKRLCLYFHMMPVFKNFTKWNSEIFVEFCFWHM